MIQITRPGSKPLSETDYFLIVYFLRLSQDDSTVFGSTLKRFIECTVEAEECDPQVVIRNVRQFLNGFKNYLVKHGEGDLHGIIETESARLNSNEFLNID